MKIVFMTKLYISYTNYTSKRDNRNESKGFSSNGR